LTKIIQKIKKELTELAMQPLINLETKGRDKRLRERRERFEQRHPNKPEE
jgi:hypothetical protein